MAAVVCAVALGACGDDLDEDLPAGSTPGESIGGVAGAPDPTGLPASKPDSAPAWLSATVNGTWPRDLVDRGLVNVELAHRGDTTLVVESRQLRADFFSRLDPQVRSSRIAPGADVNLQTEFGEVVDCESPGPTTAVIRLRYRTDAMTDTAEADVQIEAPALLDEIRARQCTAAALRDVADVSFGDPSRDGQTVTVDLVLSRTVAGRSLRIESVGGTVIFAATAPRPGGDVLAGLEDTARVPVTFSVARCDPHALAESTKQLGFDVWVAIDAGDAHRVGVPLTAPVETALLDALDECKRAHGVGNG